MKTPSHVIFAALLTGLCITSCKESAHPSWTEITSPAGPGSEVPNLHTGPEGDVYMSWIEWADDTTSVFYFSRFGGDGWTEKKEIARGTDWFVNWADYPSLMLFGDGKHMAAHWLQKSAAGRYDYNVMVSMSPDGGTMWETPFILHRDTVPAEHGFVSSVRDDDRLFYVWLDGRQMAGEDHSHGHEGHSGRMLLLGAWLSADGTRSDEYILDTMTCECCQTNVVKTRQGLMVTYRDRSDEEIRDISHVTWDGRVWSSPETVIADTWKIGGCPVNGPSAAAQGDTLYRVWYGKKDTLDHVSLITSADAGLSWGDPIVLDDQKPLGRVDVVSDGELAWVSWISRDEADSTWVSVAAFEDLKVRHHGIRVCKIDPRRKSGFPQLGLYRSGVIMAYTAVEGEETSVRVMGIKN